jgi:acetyl-CoA C-acetyltransferase
LIFGHFVRFEVPVTNGFDAVILSACRTPIGSFGGVLKDVSAVDLAAVVVREAMSRARIAPDQVGDVVLGCVLQAGAGMNVARQAALRAGLPIEVPAETVNRVCGSGLQAVVHAVEALQVGYVDVVVAGGTESMSNAPYLLKGARWGYRMGNAEATDLLVAEGLTCAINPTHMGITAEEVASRYGISRADQDRFAAESQQRAARAARDGSFTAEMVPVEVPQRKGDPLHVDVDEYPRPGTTAETLAALKPAFKKDGTVTAGNAPPVNDGASALIVMSSERARELGVVPLARIVGQSTSGLAPKMVLMTPVEAVRRLLKKTGWTLRDVDLVELNEAFSVQAVAVLNQLGLDESKVNVNGGAVALGHAIGSSGSRVLTTLLYALQHRQLTRGIATLCLGGGNGVAVAVERM